MKINTQFGTGECAWVMINEPRYLEIIGIQVNVDKNQNNTPRIRYRLQGNKDEGVIEKMEGYIFDTKGSLVDSFK